MFVEDRSGSRAAIAIAAVCVAAGVACNGPDSPPATTEGVQASGVITTFAVLPQGAPAHPEGLCADEDGNIITASFELAPVAPPTNSPTAATTAPFALNYLYVFDPLGRLKTMTPLPATAPASQNPVVPLGCVVKGKQLFVNDVYNGDVLRYDLPLNSWSAPRDTFHLCGGFAAAFGQRPLPTETKQSFCALNANYVGPDGLIYATDNGAGKDIVGAAFDPSFLNGRIFQLNPSDGTSSVWFADDRLGVTGLWPEFGANGIAADRQGQALYVANMSANTIYRIQLENCARPQGCTPGPFSVFIQGNGIEGPDNMDFDDQGNLWVASGQNDTVVGINPQGQVVKRVGSFGGFTSEGVPIGLLQPSGIVFTHGNIYVGNESNITLRMDPINWNRLKGWSLAVFDPSAP